MKTCPKCGYENEQNVQNCKGCGEPIFSKYCSRCKRAFSTDDAICPKCGQQLTDITGVVVKTEKHDVAPSDHPAVQQTLVKTETEADSYHPIWMYLLAILFPTFGILVGSAYLVRNETTFGRRIILISFLVLLVVAFVTVILPLIRNIHSLNELNNFLQNINGRY